MAAETTSQYVKRRLVSGSVWVFAGQLLGMGLGLVIAGSLSRTLGAEVGAYFLATSIVGFAMLVGGLGIPRTSVRLVAASLGADQPGQTAATVSIAMKLAVTGSVAIACLYALAGGEFARAAFADTQLSQLAGAVAVWILARTLLGAIAAVFRGLHAMREATALDRVIPNVLIVAAIATAYAAGVPLTLARVLWLVAGCSAITAVAGAVLLLWRMRTMPPADDASVTARGMLGVAVHLWITDMALFAIYELDLWIVGAYGTPKELALYGATTRLVRLLGIASQVVGVVVPPLIAELYARGETRQLERTLRTIATAMTVPAVLALIVFAFAGDWLLSLAFGDYFRDAYWLLLVLSAGVAFNYLVGPCGNALMMTGHERAMMIVTLGCGVIALVGAVVAVRSYGAIGVAVAVSLSKALQNAIMLVQTRAYCGFWTYARLWPWRL